MIILQKSSAINTLTHQWKKKGCANDTQCIFTNINYLQDALIALPVTTISNHIPSQDTKPRLRETIYYRMSTCLSRSRHINYTIIHIKHISREYSQPPHINAIRLLTVFCPDTLLLSPDAGPWMIGDSC